MLESLFNNAAGLRVSYFIKKTLQHRCFSVKFENFLRIHILRTLLQTTASKGSGKSEAYSEPCQRSKMKLPAEKFSAVNKKLYLVRCLTEFWICLWHNSTKFANYYNLLNKSFKNATFSVF